MADKSRPPLWLVMDEAAARADYLDHPHAERVITAAAIRALADWLVPEEFIPRAWQGARVVAAEQRRYLRRLLLAEADRAEAGE